MSTAQASKRVSESKSKSGRSSTGGTGSRRSPWLYKRFAYSEYWRTSRAHGEPWFCADGLAEYFGIPRGTVRVRLVARRRKTVSSYHLTIVWLDHVCVEGREEPYIMYDAEEWLLSCIRAGYPHVSLECECEVATRRG